MPYRQKHKVEWKTYSIKVPAGAGLMLQKAADRNGTSVYEMLQRDIISKYCPNYMPILDNPDSVRGRQREALKRNAPKFTTLPDPDPIFINQVMPRTEEVCSHPPVKRFANIAGTFCACGKQIHGK